jgi:hypothetical protein
MDDRSDLQDLRQDDYKNHWTSTRKNETDGECDVYSGRRGTTHVISFRCGSGGVRALDSY